MAHGTCSLPTCGAEGRLIAGLCTAHYNRRIRYGTVRADLPVVKRDYSLSLAERFWAKVQKGDGCWEWTAFLNPKGYGIFGLKRGYWRSVGAHRVAYELTRGPIPDGLEIDHLCRNRRCVRPDHLEAVTGEENTRRGDAGRYWAEKTHCPQGHPYSPENTYPQKGKYRACRQCALDSSRRWRERQRDLRSGALRGV